jgi:hypothetical protein
MKNRKQRRATKAQERNVCAVHYMHTVRNGLTGELFWFESTTMEDVPREQWPPREQWHGPFKTEGEFASSLCLDRNPR